MDQAYGHAAYVSGLLDGVGHVARVVVWQFVTISAVALSGAVALGLLLNWWLSRKDR